MYTFTGRIRFSETNQNRRLRMESLIDYFQDCSTFQSEDLGVGFSYLDANHAAWIINYWQIDIEELPCLGDEVITGTSPYELKGFLGLRNFSMETRDGRSLVKANSIWSLLDLEKGLPARVDDTIRSAYELQPKFDMEYLPRKIKAPAEGGREGSPVLITEQFLDSNHHVNNGQYVRLAMAYGPEDEEIGRLRVEYKKQAFLNDTIFPVIYEKMEERKTLILLNSAAGETYAAVEITRR